MPSLKSFIPTHAFMRNPCFFLIAVLFLCSCSKDLILTSVRNGMSIQGVCESGMGKSRVKFEMPSGNIFDGYLIWIPPGSTISTGLINTNRGLITTTGMSSGNTGMLKGAVIGSKGGSMAMELICNAFTGNCVGSGILNGTEEYNAQVY